MRIVLEPGSYSLENVGDVAMLQVAVRRLREFWPTARIGVVTEAPRQLATVCPETEPILTTRELFQRVPSLRTAHRRVARALRQKFGRTAPAGSDSPEFHEFAATVRAADLVVASGMGSLTDHFSARASRLLGTLALAERSDIPTALFSQGVGPVRDPAFKYQVARALVGVDLMAVRERLRGPALLAEMGVSPDVVRVTGDDAIELAYEARPPRSGNCLGINVRLAEYAGVDAAAVKAIRDVVHQVVARLQIQVLPIPISHRYKGLDARTNRALLGDIDPASDGGAALLTPRDVIHQVGRCRLVLAGSYHAAVFAMSQGIPVVGLVNSPYYADKFHGLADMFGAGCEIVQLSGPGFAESLTAAIERGWECARHAGPKLLAAATHQVDLGHAAYRDLLVLPSVRPREQIRAAGC